MLRLPGTNCRKLWTFVSFPYIFGIGGYVWQTSWSYRYEVHRWKGLQTNLQYRTQNRTLENSLTSGLYLDLTIKKVLFVKLFRSTFFNQNWNNEWLFVICVRNLSALIRYCKTLFWTFALLGVNKSASMGFGIDSHVIWTNKLHVTHPIIPFNILETHKQVHSASE